MVEASLGIGKRKIKNLAIFFLCNFFGSSHFLKVNI